MRDKLLYIPGAAAFLILAWTINAMARLPREASQGAVYNIIFFHVPVAIVAVLAAAVAMIASLLFLRTRNFAYDAVAVAVTEVGLVFLAANLVTGSIWGRIVWGQWWAWDAELTSALVCWLLYAAYLMLRHAIEEPTQRATSAAVVSIFAFIDAPIVVFAITSWRTQHAQPVLWGGGSLPPGSTAILIWNTAAMILLAVVLVAIRLREEETQREIDSLRRMAHAM